MLPLQRQKRQSKNESDQIGQKVKNVIKILSSEKISSSKLFLNNILNPLSAKPQFKKLERLAQTNC